MATQYRRDFDAAGNDLGRTATGVVQYFVTGADGNYYFDVESTPAAPMAGTPEYDLWFANFGHNFEYEISLPELPTSRILTNSANGDIGYALQDQAAGTPTFMSGARLFDVQIFESNAAQLGATTIMKDVNFLLEQDPVLTQGTVTGQLFVDLNGDDTLNGSEVVAPGVLVYLDLDNSGTLNGMEPNVNTDASGNYTLILPNVSDGQQVTVKVDQADLDMDFPDHEFLNPMTGEQIVSLVKGGTVNADFTLRPDGFFPGVSGIISGLVYQDANGNGMQDGGEGPLSNVRVFVDSISNGVFDAGELEGITNASGQFTIVTPSGGIFPVLPDLMNLGGTDFEQTDPAGGGPINVTLANGGEDNTLVFGIRSLLIQDFGDLFVDMDHNYPTLLANTGARHVVVPGIFLGATVDVELDGVETMDATGDDNAGTPDDEDGVELLTPITSGGTVEFDITATGAGSLINAWVDFNDDGDWDDLGEQILTDAAFVSGATNRFVITAPIDVKPTADFFAARFRVGPFGLSYDGPANAGEVEDYLLPAAGPGGAVMGDVNGDGMVDLLDLDIVGMNFGLTPATPAQGDLNGDNVVDLLDLDIVGMNFGSSSFALASAPVATPEEPDYLVDFTTVVDEALLVADSQTASIDPPGIPELVLHGPMVIEINQAEITRPVASFISAALDESFALPELSTPEEDALETALLEWSLDSSFDEGAFDESTESVPWSETDPLEEEGEPVSEATNPDDAFWSV